MRAIRKEVQECGGLGIAFLFAMPIDTFIVGIYFGHRIVSWPFGRIDVSRDRIAVRSWPAGRRSIVVSSIHVKSVALKRGRAVSTLRVDDVEGQFANAVVEIPFGADRIMAQLTSCGYQVGAGA